MQDHIEPILHEQESRPTFDIVESETCLLREMTPGKSQHFSSLVSGLPKWQASRMFLATLQLANAGNVVLQHSNNVPLERNFTGTDLDVVCKAVSLIQIGGGAVAAGVAQNGGTTRKKTKV